MFDGDPALRRLNSTISTQGKTIEQQRRALLLVEEWWLSEGMKHFTGAPYAIFAVREALGHGNQQSTNGSK